MIASIINECRPSIKSSIFSTLTLDSRNSRVIPTAGSYAQLRLVLLLPPPNPQSYSGFLGDVNQFRTELRANTNFAVSARHLRRAWIGASLVRIWRLHPQPSPQEDSLL